MRRWLVCGAGTSFGFQACTSLTTIVINELVSAETRRRMAEPGKDGDGRRLGSELFTRPRHLSGRG